MSSAAPATVLSSRDDDVPWFGKLYIQVLIAIAVGCLVGYLWPGTADTFKPLGDALIKVIRMTIAPIVFCTVVHGIAGMKDMRTAGRVGVKALLYFEVVTTLALVVGLLVINLWRPGAGLNVDPAALDPNLVQSYVATSQHTTVSGFLLDIIPDTVFGALARGDLLQVLFFAVLFAIALQRFGARGQPILRMIGEVQSVFFLLMAFVMKFAPIGAFGAMAFTIGRYGIGSVLSLANFMLAFYATCLLFIFVVLGTIARLCGFRVLHLIRYLQGGVAARVRHLVVRAGAAALDRQDGGCGMPMSRWSGW